MFQQIYSDFVKGETYCVKFIKGEFIGDLIFTHYSYSKTGVWFDDTTGHYGYLLQLNEVKIYRHVSQEEYYTKLKKKYDDKCLNSVLKRLVNEHFEW